MRRASVFGILLLLVAAVVCLHVTRNGVCLGVDAVSTPSRLTALRTRFRSSAMTSSSSRSSFSSAAAAGVASAAKSTSTSTSTIRKAKVQSHARARVGVGVGVGARVKVAVTVTMAAPAINIAHNAGQHCELWIDTAGGATTTVGPDMISPLRRCAPLLAALPGGDAAVSQMDEGWVQDVTVTAPAIVAPVAVAWGADITYPAAPGGAVVITIRLYDVNALHGEGWSLADAAMGQPKACFYAPATRVTNAGRTIGGMVYSPALINACGQVYFGSRPLPRFAGMIYTFGPADVHELTNAPNAALRVGHRLPFLPGGQQMVLRLNEPVMIRVMFVTPQTAATALQVWVPRSCAESWNHHLVDAINTHPLFAKTRGRMMGGARDSILSAGGAVVAWNAPIGQLIAGNARTNVEIDYFHGGLTDPNLFPRNVVTGFDSNNYAHNAPIDNFQLDDPLWAPYGEVLYLNTVSGGVHSGSARRNEARAQLKTAVKRALGLANDAVPRAHSPQMLYDVLSGDGAVWGSPSRVLKNDLEEAHAGGVPGAFSNAHFGYALFVLDVRVHRRAAAEGGYSPSAPVKQIGWLAFADNLSAAAPRVHTEQRILEQLRLFIIALETATASPHLHITVVGIRSRWVTDYFPDRDPAHFCEWNIQLFGHCATVGRLKNCQYTQAFRQHAVADPGQGPHAPNAGPGTDLGPAEAVPGAVAARALALANGGLAPAADYRSRWGVNEYLRVNAIARAGVNVAWTLPVGHHVFANWGGGVAMAAAAELAFGAAIVSIAPATVLGPPFNAGPYAAGGTPLPAHLVQALAAARVVAVPPSIAPAQHWQLAHRAMALVASQYREFQVLAAPNPALKTRMVATIVNALPNGGAPTTPAANAALITQADETLVAGNGVNNHGIAYNIPAL